MIKSQFAEDAMDYLAHIGRIPSELDYRNKKVILSQLYKLSGETRIGLLYLANCGLLELARISLGGWK